ncbi:Ubiquitin carboxyl-terminal hydrolase 35 [Mortierella sp. NVP85]|nr:Ubiquitin carboxyl-terminal hydrolase 35 [Mortierella sp. NVP85]
MESLIKGVLAQPTLADNVKSAVIANLLGKTSALGTPDAIMLLELGVELKSNPQNQLESQTGESIFLAISLRHRDLFLSHFYSGWFNHLASNTIKLSLLRPNMALQTLFISMFVDLPTTRPFAISKYIEFLVDYIANEPTSSTLLNTGHYSPSKDAMFLLQERWRNGRDDVIMTMPHLFLNLSDDSRECPVGIGYLLQAVPAHYTSVIDPFIQNMDASALWRLKFPLQRLIDWLVTIDLPGVWIEAIMASLASRGEFEILRKLADQNAYKIARQLPFKERRNDAIQVLRFMLLGYHHSPILFHNIAQGLLPLLVSCRKSKEDIAFAAEVCNLAQTLVIHFGDADGIGTKVQKARVFLDLPVVQRADAVRTMQESAWKRSLHIQKTSAGFHRKPTFVQPLGKVGLVNMGNSCFMNSALRALFCTTDFKEAILNDTLKVDKSKVITTQLRETFNGLSTPRLAIFTPSPLYRALPDWLNDGRQQDAAEFIKILFSRIEDEDPVSKRTLNPFHGTMMNQVHCNQCGTISSNKESFYDLSIPIPRAGVADLQAIADIFPSTEELRDANKYYCDHCQSLQDAKRITLATSIKMRIQEGHEAIDYNLYAVVIHTGESANCGHYYTYAKVSEDPGTEQDKIPWLLYNDTSVTTSSFEAMQQTLARDRADTPYMLFFRQTDAVAVPVDKVSRSNKSTSNL